jgi:hypothetical protein
MNLFIDFNLVDVKKKKMNFKLTDENNDKAKSQQNASIMEKEDDKVTL